VHFNPDRAQLECPCHSGSFSAKDGRPLTGPPQRPLTTVPLTIRNGKVWAT
jgi:nitrite reductase/ring-hydroxylating ferredoxin subunit